MTAEQRKPKRIVPRPKDTILVASPSPEVVPMLSWAARQRGLNLTALIVELHGESLGPAANFRQAEIKRAELPVIEREIYG